MSNERKKLYTAVFINFLIGIMVGIVLFYGQMNSSLDLPKGEYTYDTSIELADFFRVSWLDMLWLFSVFITHNIFPLAYMYPIIVIRGCCNSFCLMYIFNFIGIKEGVVSVLSQCFSILPLLMFMCVNISEKRRRMNLKSSEVLSLSRIETLMIFLLSMLSGAVETLFFRFFCICLF